MGGAERRSWQLLSHARPHGPRHHGHTETKRGNGVRGRCRGIGKAPDGATAPARTNVRERGRRTGSQDGAGSGHTNRNKSSSVLKLHPVSVRRVHGTIGSHSRSTRVSWRHPRPPASAPHAHIITWVHGIANEMELLRYTGENYSRHQQLIVQSLRSLLLVSLISSGPLALMAPMQDAARRPGPRLIVSPSRASCGCELR